MNSKKPELLLFPYGGNAIESLDIASKNYSVVGFIDDSSNLQGKTYHGIPIRNRNLFTEFPLAKVLAVPGNPTNFYKRTELIRNLNIPKDRFTSLISSSASIGLESKIGANCLIFQNVVISSNAIINDNVIILPSSVIHHDSELGDGTIVGSGSIIAGKCNIGRNVYIGSGVRIRNGINIGEGALIGMGSVVTKDVPPRSISYGVPAVSVKERNSSSFYK